MDVVTTGTTMGTNPRSKTRTEWLRDRRFYTGMAIAAAVIILIGFAPTYYLKGIYGTPSLSILVHLHGMLFSCWIALLITQTSLVAVKRTDLHRRLGVVGIGLAALMTLIGFPTAVAAVQRGRMDPAFLAVPMGSLVVFPTLVAAAVLMRRNAEAHKRLMLIATAELLTAGTGRWPIVRDLGAVGNYVATDVFIAALLMFDLATRRRPHPATIWGGLFFVVSQPLRNAIGTTEPWRAFAAWLTS
jgi:hypothetical protein